MVVDALGNIVVLIRDPSPTMLEISVRRSVDGGISFLPPTVLTSPPFDSLEPRLAIDLAGNIGVIWRDLSSGNSDIFAV